MQLPQLIRTLPAWVVGLTIALAPAFGWAQDGKPPVGPSTTAPNTDALNPPRTAPLPPRAESSDEVLPAVPATASDPAPPGTRAVRVDTPVPVEGAPSPDPTSDQPINVRGQRRAVAAVPARRAPGVVYAEGVVTGITDLALRDKVRGIPDARIAMTIDTWRDWSTAARPAAAQPGGAPAGAARTGAAPADVAAQRIPQGTTSSTVDQGGANVTSPLGADDHDMTFVITRRTHVYSVARTPDGYDLYGTPVTANAGQVAVPGGAIGTRAIGVQTGSFVVVRYRRVGDVNEILNLSLITPMLATAPTAVAPGRAVPGVVAPAPGAVAGQRPIAGPDTNPTPLEPNTGRRVPRVPMPPVDASPGALISP